MLFLVLLKSHIRINLIKAIKTQAQVFNMVDDHFIIAKSDEIKRGETTDIYFVRTVDILKKDKLDNVIVSAEFTISSIPKNYGWIVFAGLREVLKLLEGLPVDVYAVPEGTILPSRDINGIRIPVLTIQGPYAKFAIFETPILGFLAAASGYASKAARIRKIAGKNVLLLNFGARRTHPAIAPFCDFYSYIGGFNSVSCIKGAEYLNKKPTGTMPHALLIIYKFMTGDHSNGWKAFHKYMPEDVPRILLVDTFSDEIDETLKAIESIGYENTWGVRLDTPGSRRGNFADIIRELKWKLKVRGYDKIKIVVSGGINEDNIKPLIEAGAEAFGIGSAIATAPFIDYAMDIVSIKKNDSWIPITKRGKFDGIKQLWRYRSDNKMYYRVTLHNEPKPTSNAEPLLEKVMENGKIIKPIKNPDEIREYVLTQLEYINTTNHYPWY